MSYAPGIFNETFDTVLFKPGERDAQLYRFACEMVYCLIHSGQIRLSEPQGTDQRFIIRLLEESTGKDSNLDQVVRHLCVVQKGADKPLAVSLAQNLLNPKYDCSSLGIKAEARRRLDAPGHAGSGKTEIESALSLIHAIAPDYTDDGECFSYWERVLREGSPRAAGEDLEKWNDRRQADAKLPFLAPAHSGKNPALKGRGMGDMVKDLCMKQRPQLWNSLEKGLPELCGLRMQETQSQDEKAKLQTAYASGSYFNTRSHFYTDICEWKKVISGEDFAFFKELLDSVYNKLVANTVNARQRNFLPGDTSSADQAEAQRLVADECRTEHAERFGMIYQSSPSAWTWPAFLDVMRAVNEALNNEAFTAARMHYLQALERRSQWEALKRLQDPLNRAFEPAGVRLLVNDDRTLTVAQVHVASKEGNVVLAKTDSLDRETVQGESTRES